MIIANTLYCVVPSNRWKLMLPFLEWGWWCQFPMMLIEVSQDKSIVLHNRICPKSETLYILNYSYFVYLLNKTFQQTSSSLLTSHANLSPVVSPSQCNSWRMTHTSSYYKCHSWIRLMHCIACVYSLVHGYTQASRPCPLLHSIVSKEKGI